MYACMRPSFESCYARNIKTPRPASKDQAKISSRLPDEEERHHLMSVDLLAAPYPQRPVQNNRFLNKIRTIKISGHPFNSKPNTAISGRFSRRARPRTDRINPAKERIKTRINQNMKPMEPTMKITEKLSEFRILK